MGVCWGVGWGVCALCVWGLCVCAGMLEVGNVCKGTVQYYRHETESTKNICHLIGILCEPIS